MDQAAPQAAEGSQPQGVTPALAAERVRIQQQLPGWDVWWVAIHEPRGTRWCGRPQGHPVGVAWGDTGDELIENARAWAADDDGAAPGMAAR